MIRTDLSVTSRWLPLLATLMAALLPGCSGLPGSVPEPVQERPLDAQLETGGRVVEAGLLDGVPLTGDVQFGTKGHVSITLALDQAG